MSRSLGLFAFICLVCYSAAVAQTPTRGRSLIEFRPARMTRAAGYPLVKSVGDTTFYLANSALISDDDIVNATTDTSALNALVVTIHLTPSAASRLQEFTQRHLREYLAVYLNGQFNGSPALIVDTLSTSTLTLEVARPADAQQFAAAVAARWPSGH